MHLSLYLRISLKIDAVGLYKTLNILSALYHLQMQAIKYVTLEGEASKKVWQFVTREGQGHVTSHFKNVFIIHMKPEIES